MIGQSLSYINNHINHNPHLPYIIKAMYWFYINLRYISIWGNGSFLNIQMSITSSYYNWDYPISILFQKEQEIKIRIIQNNLKLGSYKKNKCNLKWFTVGIWFKKLNLTRSNRIHELINRPTGMRVLILTD